jgi:chromate reductase
MLWCFVTPEYNRSVPGVLKNALDVGSRPYGLSVWDGKPAAIVSVSTGALGGFGANHHLRQSLVFLNMPAMPQPEAYLGAADTLFDQHGELQSASTRDYLRQFLGAFSSWIEKVRVPTPTCVGDSGIRRPGTEAVGSGPSHPTEAKA